MTLISGNGLPFDLYESQIPGLITWFNGFVGFSEIQNRANRAENKIKDLKMLAPAVVGRFQFHSTYMQLVRRNRTFRKIDVTNYEFNRVLSCIATIRELARTSGEVARKRLRSRILDGLSPDRDIRELEHEIRAFAHYRQSGYPIEYVDSEDVRFDFLVHGPNGKFELECKTFAEDIGSAISIDDSIRMFRIVRDVLQSSMRGTSGILTIRLAARIQISETEFRAVIEDFVAFAPAQKMYPLHQIRFERKAEWSDLIRAKNLDAVLEEMVRLQNQNNLNAMVAISGGRAIMVCLESNKPLRIIAGIIDRLQKASDQFSKQRPALIWGHFLAWGEEGFAELTRPEPNGRRVIDIFGHRLFRSERRRHISRLRLSADAEHVTELTGRFARGRSLTTARGPAYDMVSHVSTFQEESTF